MTLELTDQQISDVMQALDAQLETLMRELTHADHRELREALRRQIDRLEDLRRRMQAAEDSSEAYA
jgi:hypothetical protein